MLGDRQGITLLKELSELGCIREYTQGHFVAPFASGQEVQRTACLTSSLSDKQTDAKEPARSASPYKHASRLDGACMDCAVARPKLGARPCFQAAGVDWLRWLQMSPPTVGLPRIGVVRQHLQGISLGLSL